MIADREANLRYDRSMTPSIQEQRDSTHLRYMELRAAREVAKTAAQESLVAHQAIVHTRDNVIRECQNVWADYRYLDKQLRAEQQAAAGPPRGPGRPRNAFQLDRDPQFAAEQIRRGFATRDDIPDDQREAVLHELGDDQPEAETEGQDTPDDASMTEEDAVIMGQVQPSSRINLQELFRD